MRNSLVRFCERLGGNRGTGSCLVYSTKNMQEWQLLDDKAGMYKPNRTLLPFSENISSDFHLKYYINVHYLLDVTFDEDRSQIRETRLNYANLFSCFEKE